MWHVLRAELAYSRPYLLGGLGLAAGVATLVSVIFYLVGDEGPPSIAAAGIRGMFFMMAPLIVGFIAQAYRSEERRARLLLAGPSTPRQIGGAAVLLPVVLLGIGLLAAALAMGAGFLVTGRLEVESLNIAGFVGMQIFAYAQLGLLAQEAVAARGQRRPRAAVAGWAVFGGTIVLTMPLFVAAALGWLGSLTWIYLVLGHLILAAAAMAASVALYAGRTDFTR